MIQNRKSKYVLPTLEWPNQILLQNRRNIKKYRREAQQRCSFHSNLETKQKNTTVKCDFQGIKKL
jgi:hypothetical protein